MVPFSEGLPTLPAQPAWSGLASPRPHGQAAHDEFGQSRATEPQRHCILHQRHVVAAGVDHRGEAGILGGQANALGVLARRGRSAVELGALVFAAAARY
jgi:hypothetical protein